MVNRRNVLVLAGITLLAGIGLLVALNQSKKNVCPFLSIVSAVESGNSSDGGKADFIISINNTSSVDQEIFLFLTPLDAIMQTTDNSSASIMIPPGTSQVALSMQRSQQGKASIKVSLKVGDVCDFISFQSNPSV